MHLRTNGRIKTVVRILLYWVVLNPAKMNKRTGVQKHKDPERDLFSLPGPPVGVVGPVLETPLDFVGPHRDRSSRRRTSVLKQCGGSQFCQEDVTCA